MKKRVNTHDSLHLVTLQIMEHCKGGDLFKVLMMKGGTLDEAWVCKEVCPASSCSTRSTRTKSPRIAHYEITTASYENTAWQQGHAMSRFHLRKSCLARHAQEVLSMGLKGAPEVC